MSAPPRVRLGTYCCPSQSVEYFAVLQQYLQQELRCAVDLIYDTSKPGPGVGDQDHIDAAFVSTRYGMDLESGAISNPYKVLPVGAVTVHPEDRTQSAVGYWSVLLVKEGKSDLQKFSDLRGRRLAYSDPTSVSGASTLLSKLKQEGENAAFFSDVTQCSSHLSAIKALVDHESSVAVVDSVALARYRELRPLQADKVSIMATWGPHPPHPVVVSDKMTGPLREQLLSALLRLCPHTSRPPGSPQLPWLDRLRPFGVLGFGAPSQELKDNAVAMVEESRTLSIGVTYY